MSDDEAEEAPPLVCAIAKPLADAKLTKKVLKVVKKGARLSRVPLHGTVSIGIDNVSCSACWLLIFLLGCAAAKGKQVRRGVKEVTKALRKKTQG